MDFAFTPEDEAFRAELRGWLEEHLADFREHEQEGARDGTALMSTMERRRAWQRRLNEGRWAAIHWPTERGGREATILQNVIYAQEMPRARTAGLANAKGY